MTVRVFVSDRAKRDVRVILTWIEERSCQGARNWLDVFEATVSNLPKTAASCSLAAEAEELQTDLRQKLFKTRRGNLFRLVFVIRDETIHVLAVRGSGQDLLQAEDFESLE